MLLVLSSLPRVMASEKVSERKLIALPEEGRKMFFYSHLSSRLYSGPCSVP